MVSFLAVFAKRLTLWWVEEVEEGQREKEQGWLLVSSTFAPDEMMSSKHSFHVKSEGSLLREV
jgi:hypothetical protein